MKLKITGFADNAGWGGTYKDEDINLIGTVHVVEFGGDEERTACSVDLTCGIKVEETKAPVSCRKCHSIVKKYKSVKLSQG